MVTVPVTLIWSYPVPAAVPSTSIVAVEPLARVRLPVEIVPGLLPGAMVPPLATVTAVEKVLVPPSVAPEATV